MPSKDERQAGYIAAGIGAITAIAGFALDEPSLIALGVGGIAGGLAVGVGFEPEVGAGVGAGAAALTLGGLKAGGFGEKKDPPTEKDTPQAATDAQKKLRGESEKSSNNLLLPAAVVGGLLLLA